MYSLLQCFSLCIFLFLLASNIKSYLMFRAVAFLFAIYISMEAVAVYTLGRFIDYQFYFHFNPNSLQKYGPHFLPEIGIFMALAVFLWLTFLYLRSKISASLIEKTTISLRLITMIAALVFMAAPGGIVAKKFEIQEILNSEETSFEEALTGLGIRPEGYITQDELQAQRGKNIIVITVESLEAGFLGDTFQGITPVLSDLANRWTYFHGLQQTRGSEWTSAAIYSYQLGIPAFFKGQGNSYFQNSRSAKLVGLGNILNKAGYESRFLIGDAQFAGINDLMRVYEIPVIDKDSTSGDYPHATQYGLPDLDLFTEARLQVESFKRADSKPFALFITTVDTHCPNGIYDERMERFVAPRGSDIEFTVSSVDYLIGEFLQYLEDANLLTNTAVYIFPDHLMMCGEIMEKLENDSRHLYLITNVERKKLTRRTSEPSSLLNLPRLILEGAEIETNATFLTDNIDTNDLPNYLSTNKAKLAALNHASLHRLNFRDAIEVYVKNNKITVISGQEEIIRGVDDDNLDGVLDFTLNYEMSIVESGWVHRSLAYQPSKADIESDRLHLMIFLTGGRLEYVYLGDKGAIGITRSSQRVVFTENEISNLLAENSQKEMRRSRQERADSYSADARRFIAHAGGAIEGHTYTNSLEAMNLSYKKGFRLFELDIIKTADNSFVAAHDWKHWASQSGYTGDEAPDLKTFMGRKILGKYTPMDMESINSWFASHPDAILVTDKTNDATGFSQQFVDKQRLMMELFSWQAVTEGIQAGIRSAMPTDRLLRGFTEADVSALIERGVTAVASTRRLIEQDKALVHNIVRAGIKIYAFHVNVDLGKDEAHVVCNENRYFFGMYADNWEVGKRVHCQ